MSLVCEWFVLCERVIVDAATGNFTLVACLEQLNALKFPAHHATVAFAARYRWTGTPFAEDTTVTHRLIRLSDHDEPEEIAETQASWKAGTHRGRVVLTFQMLRLLRAELLRFRLDHRVGDGEWVEGPSCYLDVVAVKLTAEQRDAMRAELVARGLPTTVLDD